MSAEHSRYFRATPYVKTLDKTGIPALKELDWFEFGLEQRTRFEYRDDNYLADLEDTDQFLMRSRVYMGIRKILEPFRFGLEFQDSRQFGAEFPETNRDVDENDFLQAFGELFFENALGDGPPLSFRFGRMSFDYIDRRSVGRNWWRNTTNAFDGVRLQFGQQSNDWNVDILAAQPVDRRVRQFDHPDEERWLYGIVGGWRKWSPYVLLEPYYFILDQDRKSREMPDREIHTLGLRGYGLIGKTGFDYDFDVAFQFGEDGQRDQRAFASHAQVGYTFDHPWQPRVGVWANYASGDERAADQVSERFDALFAASRGHYGYMDLFTWQNMINPALQVTVRPTDKLTFDAFYRVYWLASDSDARVVPGRCDPTGKSGDFVGQEIDLAARYQFTKWFELEIGYAKFLPGGFVESTGPSDDSDLFYVQTTLRF